MAIELSHTKAKSLTFPAPNPAFMHINPPARFTRFASLFSALVGLLVLIGWQFDLPYLKSPIPSLVTMNPLTAVSFLLVGAWIRFYAAGTENLSRQAWVLYLVPTVILAMSLLKWCDLLFGTSIHVDRVLFSGRIEYSQLAPTTALNFTLIGTAMFCMVRPGRRSQRVFNAVLILALFTALFSFCGYLIGDTRIYIRKPFVPMALHTALAFIVCIFSFFLQYPENVIVAHFLSRNSGGATARRILPYVLLLPFVLEWLRLQGERSNAFDAGFGVALQATATAFIFLFLIWRSAYSLNKADVKRQQNERDLEHARQEAEEASRSKTRFLASMSHEIRTPLNGVLGFADILATSEVTKEERREFLGHIKTSGELLLKLIGDILDVNKIEAGKLELENATFPFRQYISSALYPYKHTANERGLDFRLSIDESIPPYLVGDRHRINQVLVNLLGNAIKFTSAGFIGIRIEKLTERDDTVDLRILVYDSGIGIDTDRQEKVFDSFTQASESVARHYGGSGLGLTIVRELVRLMSGTIKLSSPSPFGAVSDFRGTCLELTLSLRIDRSAAPAPVEPTAEPLPTTLPRAAKILVVEDNKLNQKIAGYMLGRLGYAFDMVLNGQEAVDRVRQASYDLVFMDIHMPVLNGFQAALLIRRDGLTMPIVGLTANVFKDDVQQCLDAGMNDHLGKPYNVTQLGRMIEKWTTSVPLHPLA
ncbi:MAG: evgS [Flaviaesturariibacter sp.]|nr:evgS [Flaviaesturariibacter sp.]